MEDRYARHITTTSVRFPVFSQAKLLRLGYAMAEDGGRGVGGVECPHKIETMNELRDFWSWAAAIHAITRTEAAKSLLPLGRTPEAQDTLVSEVFAFPSQDT